MKTRIFEGRSRIVCHNGDCMEALAAMEPNQYDLAIVDPPYGIGESGKGNESRVKPFGSRKDRKNTKGTEIKATKYKPYTGGDKNPPSPKYFQQLFSCSKNQIIWGANHFGNMRPSTSWIVWDKKNGNCDFADCELAYTSFDTAVRMFSFRWAGMLQENMKNKEYRIHPNQKPVALYKWLLQNYAKPGDKILDTHGGSMSIAIACWDMGFDLDLWEMDEDYFRDGCERVEKHVRQMQFDFE